MNILKLCCDMISEIKTLIYLCWNYEGVEIYGSYKRMCFEQNVVLVVKFLFWLLLLYLILVLYFFRDIFVVKYVSKVMLMQLKTTKSMTIFILNIWIYKSLGLEAILWNAGIIIHNNVIICVVQGQQPEVWWRTVSWGLWRCWLWEVIGCSSSIAGDHISDWIVSITTRNSIPTILHLIFVYLLFLLSQLFLQWWHVVM